MPPDKEYFLAKKTIPMVIAADHTFMKTTELIMCYVVFYLITEILGIRID